MNSRKNYPKLICVQRQSSSAPVKVGEIAGLSEEASELFMAASSWPVAKKKETPPLLVKFYYKLLHSCHNMCQRNLVDVYAVFFFTWESERTLLASLPSSALTTRVFTSMCLRLRLLALGPRPVRLCSSQGYLGIKEKRAVVQVLVCVRPKCVVSPGPTVVGKWPNERRYEVAMYKTGFGRHARWWKVFFVPHWDYSPQRSAGYFIQKCLEVDHRYI